ncbi:MAG: hypothetical protein JW931_03540 [Methanomicrobiaceae archaeon]|nr:hypothetical protein [Methanomicrobiaceae archaeon]
MAGCTATEQTSGTGEKIVTQAEFQPAIESAVLLGKEHAKTMEAVQEAFAYIISGSEEEKDDFYSLMTQVDYLDSDFVRHAGMDKTVEGSDFSARHAAIVDARNKMVSSAESMFSEYEASGSVSYETAADFESAIDGLTLIFGPFTTDYFEAISDEEYGSSVYAQPATSLLKMHRDMLEAVEESFGYIALGEEEEKNDYYTTMSNFKIAATEFENSFLKENPDETEITEKYQKVISAANAYEAAAEVIFEDYESDGKIAFEDFETYEIAIDEMTTAFDELMGTVLGKL